MSDVVCFRLQCWIREHLMKTTIIGCVLFLVLLLVALAIILPLTLSSRASNGSITPIQSNLSTTNHSTTPSTTTEPFSPGYCIDISTQMFEIDNITALQSLRPDPRQFGDYILTASDHVILLSGCQPQMISLAEWSSGEGSVQRCAGNSVTVIEHRTAADEQCSRCDVLDVADSCRQNVDVCSQSSFAFCCRDCGPNSLSSATYCSLRGSPLIENESVFLDARFTLNNSTSYSLLFSTLSYNHQTLCILQQHVMRYEGVQVAVVLLPTESCDDSVRDFAGYIDDFQSVSITMLSNEWWKALLLDSGTVYLSNSNGSMHVLRDLVNGTSSKLLMQPDRWNNVLLVDFCMETGRFSASRVNLNRTDAHYGELDILVPRQIAISVPGKFMDAFLDDGQLVLWNTVENAVFVTRVRFKWT
ncbi:unnamed protein product [Anisakis simplex]|uniref:Protein kinase n=1 Tax=Anisakis simplex TaxID=6269 RepID=A0A0M3JR43_ANISI|nr:unnamed protein product [Anisakis simplex]